MTVMQCKLVICCYIPSYIVVVGDICVGLLQMNGDIKYNNPMGKRII